LGARTSKRDAPTSEMFGRGFRPGGRKSSGKTSL